MLALRGLSLAALLLAASGAVAQEQAVRFQGYAYELASNRFLYTEVHEQRIVGERWLGGTIEYYGADGARLGRKIMDFTHDPYIPVYRLNLTARGGYMEGIEAVTPERIDLVRKPYGGTEAKARAIARRRSMTADSGFHAFVRDQFERLLAGETIPFVFAVASNLDAYKFRARAVGATTFEGRPAVRLRVEPDSLLRWLVDPLELVYEPGQRKLVEYRGISNVHDPATGNAYNVRVVYPSTRPADAPALAETR